MFLKGLLAVFGDRHVFKGPVPGNFLLVDLPGKKVVFLDERLTTPRPQDWTRHGVRDLEYRDERRRDVFNQCVRYRRVLLVFRLRKLTFAKSAHMEMRA